MRPAAGWQAEIYLERDEFREINWAEKRPKDTFSGRGQGLSVRAVHEGRQGFAYANEVSAASARALWERAHEAAKQMPADPHRVLIQGAERPRDKARAPFAIERALFRTSVQDLQARLAGFEKGLLKSDRRLKKALRLSLRESASEFAVVSSEDTAVSQPFSSVSFAAELMGESKKEVQVSWDSTETRLWKELNFERVLTGARERLLNSFGAKPVSSGTWPVIFLPRVGVDFLELISGALCADAVQRGRSFLAGRRGGAVASSHVTIVDDGLYPQGIASSLYDEEGVPTQTNVVVKEGRLMGYLYDSYTAHREGLPSTGNAGRAGVQSPPSPEPSNLYLVPGRMAQTRLWEDLPKAFLVQDVMGMHTADAVSGDFSVGAVGLLVEKGHVRRAVKGVTLAGNALDMLKELDAVADDLTWYGSVGAPTFRVSGLSVGGS
ncbi:MAG: TldD/PmbA family protein [Elusimicrobia bacterium]|nr:TldD/PmbA family protein [Elusimicrobiota bacterium]